MGASASVEDCDPAVYANLKKEFDTKIAALGIENPSEEQQLEIYNHLKSEYLKMQAESPAAAPAPKMSVAEKLRIANEKADNEIAGDKFVVGDIVNAKPQGQSLFFEGVIIAVKDDGRYEVEFDDGDIDIIAALSIRQRYTWDFLEVGDHVKARYHGGYQEFEAVVIEVGAGEEGDPLYTIRYDDGEEEAQISREFIQKIYPVRCAMHHWAKARNVFKAMGAMTSAMRAVKAA